MKQVFFVLLCLFLCPKAAAAPLPEALTEAAPAEVAAALEEVDLTAVGGLREGVSALWQLTEGNVHALTRGHIRDCIGLLLVVLLCGVAEAFWPAKERQGILTLAGALAVGTLAAGDVNSMLGVSLRTMEAMEQFSKVLLPVLASSMAAAGGVARAAVWQVSTVFFADLLLSLISRLLAPLVCVYIGIVTANAALPGERLHRLAAGLKKGITWCLTGVLTLFTGYLTITGAVSGSVDGVSLKVAKMAVSTGVPVVGGVLSDAADTMLASARMIKSAVGVFGMLVVLGICLLPFLQLALQYLAYKVTAFVTAVSGDQRLVKLIEDLGGGFGLLLGMTASCAMVLLISLTMAIRLVSV